MYKNVKHLKGRVELIRCSDSLVICNEDTRLILPESRRSQGNIIYILPIEGAVITLETPDSKTTISCPEGISRSEYEITGQYIRTCISFDKWYITGISEPKPKPRGRPPKKKVDDLQLTS